MTGIYKKKRRVRSHSERSEESTFNTEKSRHLDFCQVRVSEIPKLFLFFALVTQEGDLVARFAISTPSLIPLFISEIVSVYHPENKGIRERLTGVAPTATKGALEKNDTGAHSAPERLGVPMVEKAEFVNRQIGISTD